MDLRFGGAGTDGSPRDQIGGVLRCYGVEKFASYGKPQLGYIEKEGAGDTKSFVNLEAIVEIRIVDEAFPANGRPGFFEVDSHDDHEVVFGCFGILSQELGIFNGRVDVVDGARARSRVRSVSGNVREAYPTTTSRRSSSPLRMFSVANRPCSTVCAASSVLRYYKPSGCSHVGRRGTYKGRSSCKIWGGMRGRVDLTRLFSRRERASLKDMAVLRSVTVEY